MRGAFTLAILAVIVQRTVALIHGVDSSQLVPETTYVKALGEGFTKAVIRGYEEACGRGGEVDLNFVTTYNNARTAGYTNIDAYWFPCNGSGNNCKSYATQISELNSTLRAHNMQIGSIWIDIEQDSVCNPWNYGAAGNLAQAKELIAAARVSGLAFGVYSSPGEWANIFGSDSVVVANDLPLWFATFDDDDSSLALRTPFGGWTTAFGKQYTDVSASGLFDLDIFSS